MDKGSELQKVSPSVQEEQISPRVVTYHSWWFEGGVPKDHILDEPPFFFGPVEFEGKILQDPLERLDVEVIGNNPEVVFVQEMHGNEHVAMWEELIREVGVDCVSIPNANPPAAVLNERGYIRPIAEKENPPAGLIRHVKNGHVVKKDEQNHHLGVEDDLNRQYDSGVNVSDWEGVYENIPNGQAKLLLKAIENQPQLKYVFTIHKDPEFGHYDLGNGGVHPSLGEADGFHLYYSSRDARNDINLPLVENLMKQLRKTLHTHRYHLSNGFVDPTNPDPVVNYEAHDGFIYQPMIRQDGTRLRDTTLEGKLLQLAEIDLTKIGGVFTLEFPDGLSKERERMLMQIVMKEFVLSFLQQKGLWKSE